MDYSSRLDPATYANDEPVGIAVAPGSLLPGPIPDGLWSYLPESLWQRLLSLGHAYSLHFAQVAEPVIDTVLESRQCQSLQAELAFLAGIISDPAAEQALAVLQHQAAKVARDSSLRLIISPP
jgi:hypothetical protein